VSVNPGVRVMIGPQSAKVTEVSLLDMVTAVRPTVPVLVMLTAQTTSPAAQSTQQQGAHAYRNRQQAIVVDRSKLEVCVRNMH
jgi:hypothetical protein